MNHVSFEGFDDLIERLEDVSDGLDSNKKKIVINRLANQLKGALIDVSPVDTGVLKQSWHTKRAVEKGDAISAEVYNSTDYAIHVEYGHRVRGNSNKVVKGQFMVNQAMNHFEPEFNEVIAKAIVKGIV